MMKSQVLQTVEPLEHLRQTSKSETGSDGSGDTGVAGRFRFLFLG
jgi:hypothetical protein